MTCLVTLNLTSESVKVTHKVTILTTKVHDL